MSIHRVRVLFIERYPVSATNIEDSFNIDEQITCFPLQKNVYFYIFSQRLPDLFTFKKKKNLVQICRVYELLRSVFQTEPNSIDPRYFRVVTTTYRWPTNSSGENALLNEFSRRLLWTVATRDFCVVATRRYVRLFRTERSCICHLRASFSFFSAEPIILGLFHC